MRFMQAWWMARAGNGHGRRHRLRVTRESDGRRLAACGTSAPNGWMEIDEWNTLECHGCTAAILRAAQ
jgi:hypothetical protein